MYIQDLIHTLERYWAEQGCAVLQPLDMPVGAGTFHPATTLRALGPDPWNAVYVQPSRRPTDGRGGRHPNRLQRYYQLQVVMKPSPEDFQDLYLQSLANLGIDSEQRDIRFVEDNWESPSLGAWGFGWEVWIGGMEVTQFTYFQEVGGQPCSPIMGEITYGVERLAMFLQGCDSVYDLSWNKELTYGELHLADEEEQSAYNFEGDDTDSLLARLVACQETATKLLELEKPLVMPAYEKILESSHLFNLIDARKGYSPDARRAEIFVLRDLSVKVATAYIKSLASERSLQVVAK